MKLWFIYQVVLFFITCEVIKCEVLDLKSKETLTVVELNKGDRINYRLKNGRIISFELVDYKLNLVFTTLDTLKKGSAADATIYSMSCDVRIDGQMMKMVRYIPVQETYYKPYVVNGVTIWFDALKVLSDYFNENHGKCVPVKDARFAFHDAGLQICLQELSNWYPVPANRILIKDAYRGDDSWLGTYYGADLHGGLDVNMPSNTPLIAPIDFDEHYFFNSLENGHNNNRWRGIRNWENGDIWQMQTHHVNKLVIPAYQKIKQGQIYAHGAGTWCWYSPHTHFVLNVYQPEFKTWILIDPWIVFWQIFENNRKKGNMIIANIEPLAPSRTGEKVLFSSLGSRPGIFGGDFEYFWDFGDGYTSIIANPVHVYGKVGVYPVTLTVRDGSGTASYTQHITINGQEINARSIRITSGDDPSFKTIGNWKTCAYGINKGITNTLVFRSVQDRGVADFSQNPGEVEPKTVSVWFNKSVESDPTDYPDDLFAKPQTMLVLYKQGSDWLTIERIPLKDHVDLKIKPDLKKVRIKWGSYEAIILLDHNDIINSPQYIRVILDFTENPPGSSVIVDNLDPDCIKSDYFWLSPTFHWNISEGYNGGYYINASNLEGEYIRYIPSLVKGSYEVSLFGPGYRISELSGKIRPFYVIVKHLNGIEKIKVDPLKSLIIGQFEFERGREGYVELISDGAEGLILADAVKFELMKLK